jgi:hypothetical protein
MNVAQCAGFRQVVKRRHSTRRVLPLDVAPDDVQGRSTTDPAKQSRRPL